MSEVERRRSRLAGEAARKVLHVAAALIAAVLAWLLPENTARAILVGAAVLGLGIDLARLSFPALSRAFQRLVGPMLRPFEAGRITGATTLAVGFAVTALYFPARTAGLAFLYAGLSDTAAALVGRRWGRHRTRWGKTLEGSAAFFATALAIGWLAPGVALPAAAGAALATAAVEAVPGPDNLVIPFVAALVLQLLGGAG